MYLIAKAAAPISIGPIIQQTMAQMLNRIPGIEMSSSPTGGGGVGRQPKDEQRQPQRFVDEDTVLVATAFSVKYALKREHELTPEVSIHQGEDEGENGPLSPIIPPERVTIRSNAKKSSIARLLSSQASSSSSSSSSNQDRCEHPLLQSGSASGAGGFRFSRPKKTETDSVHDTNTEGDDFEANLHRYSVESIPQSPPTKQNKQVRKFRAALSAIHVGSPSPKNTGSSLLPAWQTQSKH